MDEDANTNIIHDDSKKLDVNIDDHWMDIVTKCIDDLKPSMSEFILTKQSFDVTQVSTRIFFKELMLYIRDLHSCLLHTTPIEPEMWKNAASKIYSILRFVKPAFEDINFLRHICCMKTMGWMNVLLTDYSLPFKIRDLVCEYSIEHLKATEYDDHMTEGLFILSHLLESILKDKYSSEEISISVHKLLDLREFIRSPDWFENDFIDDLRKQIIDSIFSKNIYSTKDGIIWTSHVLCANKKFYRRTKIEDFWKKFITIDETGFAAFGEIFFNAWHLADSETKIEIEKYFIQRLMKEALVFYTKVDEKDKRLKKLLFTTLNKLHLYKYKLLSFNYMLTNLYRPLLWLYLSSSKEIERRYAAEVFFDVFPLEMSRATDQEVFMNRQIKVVKDLLSDESHDIRILAIRSICHHLIHSPASFTVLHVKTLLTVIADDLARDESYLVRITVFEEFRKMLDYPDSRKLMFRILPAMRSHLNDEHESVRKAFIDILIKIHKTTEFKMSFCKIVSTFDLLRRIDREGPVIGKQISILMYPKLFSIGQQISTTIKKLKMMCGINPKAAMYVVKYAKDEMSFSTAYEIVSSIMEYLKESLCEYRKIGGARSENSSVDPNISDGSDTISCIEFLRNHKLVISTLETITCIWELFHDEFVDGMSDTCKNLYRTSKLVIPLLIKFYKEPLVNKAIKELHNVTKTKKK